MEGYGPDSFGTFNAPDYDIYHDPGTTDESVALIAELAGTDRVLELAIGTGRVALPLARRGINIQGIEASPDMVARLREKPGGAAIPVTIGDMADVPVDGPFDFVYLIFNTLFNLTTQDAQVRCFQNVARCLAPGGAFLVEVFVPDLSRFNDNQEVRARSVDMHSAYFEITVHDPVHQRTDTQQIRLSREGMTLSPLPMRYAWPSELDLMARLAGLTLENRWGGWHREPFTANSGMHVSVYRAP